MFELLQYGGMLFLIAVVGVGGVSVGVERRGVGLPL